jgi:hypothetical protein
MPSKTTKARTHGRASLATLRHPAHRHARLLANSPAANLGWRISEFVVRRKARRRIERFRETRKTAASFAVIYGPMAAEVLGLTQAPRPKRQAATFTAGVVIGASAMYVVARNRHDRSRSQAATPP